MSPLVPLLARALFPSARLLSVPGYLSKIPPPDAMILGIRFHMMTFWGGDANIQSVDAVYAAGMGEGYI